MNNRLTPAPSTNMSTSSSVLCIDDTIALHHIKSSLREIPCSKL